LEFAELANRPHYRRSSKSGPNSDPHNQKLEVDPLPRKSSEDDADAKAIQAIAGKAVTD